ncbi:UNVERIFIED_CONTAM: hypothetical protein Cloal_3250 [Acetivibrio alkalicellulosi]
MELIFNNYTISVLLIIAIGIAMCVYAKKSNRFNTSHNQQNTDLEEEYVSINNDDNVKKSNQKNIIMRLGIIFIILGVVLLILGAIAALIMMYMIFSLVVELLGNIR